MNIGLSLLSSIILVTVLITAQQANAVSITPKDNEAKKEIITNMSNAVDHRYSQYDLLIGSKIGDNSTFTIYNKTANNPIPPVVCGTGTHLHNGTCVVNPPKPVENETGSNQTGNNNVTEPTIPPVQNKTLKVALVGDLKGTTIANALTKSKSDYNIALGDLGYGSDLSSFKSIWNKLLNHECVIGNHDSPEDGNSAIYVEAKQYCGDIWFQNAGTTLLIGFNTNGNLDTQLGTAQSYVMNSSLMQNVKNVVLVSHKPCVTPPNSHHKVESNVKTFCDSLIAKVPVGVQVYGVNGHNHVIAQTANGKWFTSGAGGKSHYECGTDSTWTFCNNKDYGYLIMEIGTDGKIQSHFYNANGGIIH